MMPRRQRKPSLKVREMQQAETDTQVPYLSEDKVGRWYKIVAATKEQNAGEYECSVNVTLDEYPGKPLDSEVAVINLTVYDSPSILHVCNFTVCLDPDVEQSAILECAVSNTEDNLEVWVNWTTTDGKEIKKEHVTLRKEDVFYLLLYNATAADYMCQLFSTYSPNDVEDKQVVAVVFSESPTTPPGGQTPKGGKSDSIPVGILSFLVAILLVATLVSLTLAVFFYRRLASLRSTPRPSTTNPQEDTLTLVTEGPSRAESPSTVVETVQE